MLNEHFIASIGEPSKAPGTNVSKDAAIFLYENQPLLQQRALYKKSATPPNCLAVSDSHIFAAQAGKALVHVYNREKGSQEATVPFAERITCLSLACNDTVLVLGTAEGRIFLWETCSGRQIVAAQSHLQTVTGLAIDGSSNFLVSVSADSTAQVWSISSLLSFTNDSAQPPSQLHTFSNHRSAITAVAIGHSSSLQNIAITCSDDKTCLVWDYHANLPLCTFLLSAVPISLCLEPADRAAYVGYSDGSLQQLTLIDQGLTKAIQSSGDARPPIQPRDVNRWLAPDITCGSLLSLAVSFDSTTVISGHQSGVILAWDVATGHVRSLPMQAALPGPVNNLKILPVTGFANGDHSQYKIETVLKPKFGAYHDNVIGIPGSYSVNIKLLPGHDVSAQAFRETLVAPVIPQAWLEEGLRELSGWARGSAPSVESRSEVESVDFMSLDHQAPQLTENNVEQQNADLKEQLAALRRVQIASLDRLEKLQAEKKVLLQREQKRQSLRNDTDVNSNTDLLTSDDNYSDINVS